jgi:hypothetical protein
MAYNPYALSCAGMRDVVADPNVVRVWTYKSEDAAATINTAGYIKDARTRGMAIGDIVHVITMAAGLPTVWTQCMVMAMTAGAADLSNGVTVALTNSD